MTGLDAQAEGSYGTAAAVERPPVGYWRLSFARFRRRRVAFVALGLVAAVLLASLLARWIAPYGYQHFDIRGVDRPPGLAHLLGTDSAGHDVLSRTLFSTRTSVEIGLFVGIAASLIGLVAGTLAGYLGGVVDAVVSWVVRFLTSIPALGLLFAGVVVVGQQPRPHWVVELLVLYLWAGMARVVRATVRSLRTTEYVEAARAAGASGARIVLAHLVPNALPAVLVTATALLGQTILLEATVEFFGYGFDPWVTPSLGGLIAEGATSGGIDIFEFWWIWFFPALVLVLVLVCVNLVGDALDESFNPALRR